MTELKKQLIMQLSVIAPHIEEMSALLYLVENSTLSDEILQMIEQMIADARKLTQSQDYKQSFEQSLLLIKQIRDQELKDREEIDLPSL